MTTIAPPPGATVDQWYDHAGMALRDFDGTRRGDRVPITVIGTQDGRGRVVRCRAIIECGPIELDAAELRALAADALAGAEEMERLA